MILSLIATVLTSGVVSAIVSGGLRRRGERLVRRSDQSGAARDALKRLEDVYVGVAADQRKDTEILPAESDFKAEVDKCAYKPLTQAADELLRVGRLYAAKDPDSSLELFETKLDAARHVIRKRMKGLN